MFHLGDRINQKAFRFALVSTKPRISSEDAVAPLLFDMYDKINCSPDLWLLVAECRLSACAGPDCENCGELSLAGCMNRRPRDAHGPR